MIIKILVVVVVYDTHRQVVVLSLYLKMAIALFFDPKYSQLQQSQPSTLKNKLKRYFTFQS